MHAEKHATVGKRGKTRSLCQARENITQVKRGEIVNDAKRGKDM